jgi:hypothetical protein
MTIAFAFLAARPTLIGSYDVKITFSGIPIINKKGNGADIGFPLIPAGLFDEQFTWTVPTIIPAGSVISINLRLYDEKNQGVVCADLTVPFK